jgi:hypothetical protein
VNRFVIFGGLAAAVAVALAIYLTRGSDDPPARTPAPATDPGATQTPAHAPSNVTPSLPGSAATPVTGSDGTITYQVDTVTVHDHRGSNAGPPIDLPPNLHPPGSRTIPPSLTGAVSREVRRVMNDCAASLPPGARGPRPKLDGEIVIAIKDNKATVTRAIMQLRDTLGDVSPVKQCLEQKSVGLSVDGQGEADLDAYSIHMTFAIGGPGQPIGP